MTQEDVTGKTSTNIVPAQGTKVSNEKYKEWASSRKEYFPEGNDPVKELVRHPGYGQAERRKWGPLGTEMILVDTGSALP